MPRTVETIVYKADELSKSARAKARNWYTHEVLGTSDNWYKHVFDDFKAVCEILGITIKSRRLSPHRAMGIDNWCIWFTGFACHGDGACFEGRWDYADDAPERIRQHTPGDEALHRIADQLDKVQDENQRELTAVTTRQAIYMHEYSMTVGVERESSDGEEPTDDAAEQVTEAMRALARWLYRRLEAAWTDEAGDSAVDEALKANDWWFTAEGAYFTT